MATYIVGDIQGCFAELQALLEQIKFTPQTDTLYVAGDLVARGSQSLETLRFLYDLGDSARCILGNHDLHLLAVASGIHKLNPKDHTENIFSAPDRDTLLDWLRHQPLLRETDEFVICHAGISPVWDLKTARKYAKKVEKELKGKDWQSLITNMYGNSPTTWSKDLEKVDKLRYTINAFTRMRFCYTDGSFEMKCKLPPNEITNPNILPWFKVPKRVELEKTVIFGHWAALMGCDDPKANVIGLDTGCVWGEHLTILRWEDKRYFTQAALNR